MLDCDEEGDNQRSSGEIVNETIGGDGGVAEDTMRLSHGRRVIRIVRGGLGGIQGRGSSRSGWIRSM